MNEPVAVEVQVAHTSQLDAPTLHAARSLLEVVFDGDVTDSDWEHGLGGIHALASRQGRIVGHASVVQRRLLYGGRALRTGYVEAVGVLPELQRQGIGGALMAPLEAIIRTAYDLGALGASDDGVPFYQGRGWTRWAGPTSALTPNGVRPTPEEDDCIFVLDPSGALDVTAGLTCDWRDGDVW